MAIATALDCKRLRDGQSRVKIIVVIFLLLIVGSLASALYYMVTDRGQSRRMLKALALRVGLSLTLFVLLMAGYYFGLIPGRVP